MRRSRSLCTQGAVAKYWTKQKSHGQKSKKKRVASHQSSVTSSKGAMSGMRNFMQKLGKGRNKPKTTVGKIVDTLLWGVIIVLAVAFYQRRCQG